jgi:hypothetical protein
MQGTFWIAEDLLASPEEFSSVGLFIGLKDKQWKESRSVYAKPKPKYAAHRIYQNINVRHSDPAVHSRLATEMGSNRETNKHDTNYTKYEYYNGWPELAGCGVATLLSKHCSTSWPAFCCTQDPSQHWAQLEHDCTSMPASFHCSQLAVLTIFRFEWQVQWNLMQ